MTTPWEAETGCTAQTTICARFLCARNHYKDRPKRYKIESRHMSANPKYHTKVCSRSCVESPGARTLVFAAFQPFPSCEFRASIARTPFCALRWRSPNILGIRLHLGEPFLPPHSIPTAHIYICCRVNNLATFWAK